MALQIDSRLTPKQLLGAVQRMFELSAEKILALERSWKAERGTPVFTVRGRYTARGWTEWTQGFQFGAALLQFDATGERRFLELGRRQTVERMAPHLHRDACKETGSLRIRSAITWAGIRSNGAESSTLCGRR